MDNIAFFFGEKFRSLQARIDSYDFIENFIAETHPDWSVAPVTRTLLQRFLEKIEGFSIQDLAFLVAHSGYIPESYEPDSSAETLYSKLIEAVVLVWAKRIGFDQSYLPTQKSSMEDVSILDANNVVVCDAKSFRLGRSQGAPNVKDVLKHSDIDKWLSAHKNRARLGGLVTFPSQHDWKTGSDFYQYTTDKTSPTLCLYYEHLAFFLVAGMTSDSLMGLYQAYPVMFPRKHTKSENNRKIYYDAVHRTLPAGRDEMWERFLPSARKVIAEKVYHCAHSLENRIFLIRTRIEEQYLNETDIDLLRKKVIETEFAQATPIICQTAPKNHRF